MVATHVGELLGLHVHGDVLLCHQVVERVFVLIEEPVLVSALGYGAYVHLLLATAVEHAILLVVEESRNLCVPHFLSRVLGGAYREACQLGGLAVLALTGVFNAIVLGEGCAVALNVVLSSLLGELASAGLVALPVFSLSLDEIKLLHGEDGVVAVVGARVSAHVEAWVVVGFH